MDYNSRDLSRRCIRHNYRTLLNTTSITFKRGIQSFGTTTWPKIFLSIFSSHSVELTLALVRKIPEKRERRPKQAIEIQMLDSKEQHRKYLSNALAPPGPMGTYTLPPPSYSQGVISILLLSRCFFKPYLHAWMV